MFGILAFRRPLLLQVMEMNTETKATMDIHSISEKDIRSGEAQYSRLPTASHSQTLSLSIIIPVLNEAAHITSLLDNLSAYQQAGAEAIVVDGGSTDDTAPLAKPYADLVIHAARGRASQMNAGAAAARGETLLFLHADTRLPANADRLITEGMSEGTHLWGRFDIRIEGQPRMLKIIAFMMSWRSRVTAIATGDQALFLRRDTFNSVGGYPTQPLMEDIELSRRLKPCSRPLCLSAKVITSGRRWESHGIWRIIFLMWSLRLRYWLGESAEKLARAYR
jgi:rSAM/selenodomain-associated transferase 2